MTSGRERKDLDEESIGRLTFIAFFLLHVCLFVCFSVFLTVPWVGV